MEFGNFLTPIEKKNIGWGIVGILLVFVLVHLTLFFKAALRPRWLKCVGWYNRRKGN